MWKYEQGTPCPALAQHTDLFSPPVFVDDKQNFSGTKSGSSSNAIDDVFDDYNENTTRNISKLMRNEFKNARFGLPQKPRRNHVQTVGVFEDGSAAGHEEMRRLAKSESGSTNGAMSGAALKARRPQKMKLETVKEDRQSRPSRSGRTSTTHDAPFLDVPEEGLSMDEMSFQAEDTVRVKPAGDTRRRTIWMPSDDTSVLTIHPGAYDQTLRDDTICLPPKREPHASACQTGPLHRFSAASARQSMATAPKRAPLKALAPVQPNAVLYDRVKCMNGKENVPPGLGTFKDKSVESHDMVASKPLKAVVKPVTKSSPAGRTSLLSQPTAASQAKVTSVKKRSAPESKDDVRRTKVAVTKDPRPRTNADTKPPSLKLSEVKAAGRLALERQIAEKQEIPNKLSVPNVQPRMNANLSRYPVLPDDLVQPELYEDNWLTHQEVALTQLINSVFEQADSKSLLSCDDVSSTRTRMLETYQDPVVVTLHKRLKASLIYGALSMPKDGKDLPRLREDVGLRRQFLDLWVQTYNLDVLQAALEVVFGRSMTSRPRDAVSVAQSLGSTSGATGSVQEKELRRFLLTFLVHHEEAVDASLRNQKSAEDQTPRVGSPEWFWQRTVLQSLMLVHLLDTSKTQGIILVASSRLRPSANHQVAFFTHSLVC